MLTSTFGGGQINFTSFQPANDPTLRSSPFPARVTVNGISGKIATLTVSVGQIQNFSYTTSLNFLLVGPQGQRVALLSTGPNNSLSLNDSSFSRITFDDNGGGYSTIGRESVQVVHPTGSDVDYLSPAPPGPYGSALADFVGTDPNGTWELYAENLGRDSGFAEGWSLHFTTDDSGDIVEFRSNTAAVGKSATVSLVSTIDNKPGVRASLINKTANSGDATIAIATYIVNPATNVGLIDVGGGFIDLKVLGADDSDLAFATVYYPSTITGDAEASLLLQYFDGSSWQPVLSDGGVAPGKQTADNSAGSVSGGVFTVQFSRTSTPSITDLTGTVFGMAGQAPATPPTILSAAGCAINSGNATSDCPLAGGVLIALSGTGFLNGPVSVNVGTNVVVQDDSHLTFSLAPGFPDQLVTPSVTNLGGTSARTAPTLRYVATPPTVVAVSGCANNSGNSTNGCPESGGVQLTIVGTGFTQGPPTANVCQNVLVIDNAHLTCALVAGLTGTTAQVQVTSDGGTSTQSNVTLSYAGSASGGTGDGGSGGGVNPGATPELDSLLLFGSGLSGLGGYALTRRRAGRRID